MLSTESWGAKEGGRETERKGERYTGREEEREGGKKSPGEGLGQRKMHGTAK